MANKDRNNNDNDKMTVEEAGRKGGEARAINAITIMAMRGK